MNDDQQNALQELPPVLRSAVEGIVAEPIPNREVHEALAVIQRTHRPAAAKRFITPRRALVLCSLAALLLLGAWILQPGGQSAWADVVEAVAGHDWLHGTGKTSAGHEVEFWYSFPKQLVASKIGNQFMLMDGRTGIAQTYNGDNANPVISRSEIKSGGRDLFALLQALLHGNVEEHLKKLGSKLAEHSHGQTTIDGEPREEFVFVIAEPNNPDMRTKMTLLVDPKTKLLTRWEMESQGLPNGRVYRIWYDLSFPDSGPETIYALGVPRSAKLVDNVPRDNLKRILKGLQQGRTDFDTYRGIAIIGSKTPVPDGRGPALCYQVWRKGTKWRIELVQPKGHDRLPADADPRAWWNTRVANSRLVLKSVSDGKRHCRLTPVYTDPPQPDADNPQYLKIVSFTKQIRTIDEPSDPWKSFYAEQMPQIVGHPYVLGQYSEAWTMSLDAKPERGPDGCVLVESMSTQRENKPRNLIGQRYWIDPARNYLVMRAESLSGTHDDQKVRQATEIMEVAQSPSGRLYPTQLRVIGGSVSLETGKRSDHFNVYYLDFDADVPDKLFEIPE